MPALVVRKLDVIDPDGGAVIHRAKVQDNPICTGRLEAPCVPNRVVQIMPADAGELRLVGKRDDDGVIEVRLVEPEPPRTIKVDPFPAA